MTTSPTDTQSYEHKGTSMRSLTGLLTAVSLSLLLGACADSTGPLPSADGSSLVPTGAISAARSGKRTTSTTTTTSPVLTPVRFAAWAPRLETYDTTFVVTQGQAAADTLYFRKDAWGLRLPYMVLTIPKDAQFVDASGKPVPNGATVKLTVHADSQLVQLNFGPHGSTFGKNPATVKVSWFHTDLMGRSPCVLKLWYQPEVNTGWNPLATLVDLQFYWLVSTLDHFSNYAVAY
jgi:hypothetical protein